MRTQLSVALAALAAHLPAAEWGPGGAIGWLASHLASQPQEVALPCMLELLTVLPQEAGSYQPAVRPERRRALHEEMLAAVPQALQVLGSCLSVLGPRTQEQVLEAFASWLKLAGGTLSDGVALAASPLVRAALEGLHSADAFFAAVDAVVELIYCTSRRGRPRDEMAQLVQAIVPEVMSLRPRCGTGRRGIRDAGLLLEGEASSSTLQLPPLPPPQVSHLPAAGAGRARGARVPGCRA